MRFDQAPASDPHGRRTAAGPRRQQPAARPGTAQRTGPGHRDTGKEENTRTGTAATTTTATTTTRSPAAGSRAGTCRRVTRQPSGEHRQPLRRSGTKPGTRWSTPGRGSPGRRHDQGAHDRTDGHDRPGSDPHGRQPAGPHRRQQQQGQERRSQPDQGTGPRAKKRTARATTTTRTTRSPAAGSRPGICRRITRQPPGEHRQPLRRSGTR